MNHISVILKKSSYFDSFFHEKSFIIQIRNSSNWNFYQILSAIIAYNYDEKWKYNGKNESLLNIETSKINDLEYKQKM
jgi:hypothetical protein